MRPFGEAQLKIMRAYAQSGKYHTIVESRVRLTPFIILTNLSVIYFILCNLVKKKTNKNNILILSLCC